MANGTSAPQLRTLLAPRTVQLLVAGCALAAFAWAAYYGFGILRSSAFNNDRAFRVLTEIVGQFDNFHGTMTSLINLIPESADCPATATCPDIWRSYTSKLNVPDIALSYVDDALVAKRDGHKIVTECEHHASAGSESVVAALANRYEFWLRLNDPGRRFTVLACARKSTAPAVLSLSGKLQTSIPHFVSQSFFDEALVALDSGTVLATIGDADGDLDTTQVQLHAANSGGVLVAHAADLLRAAAIADAASDTAATASAKAPAPATPETAVRHPTVFEKTIAGTRYQVFVLPFHPSIPWYVESDSGEHGKAGADAFQHEDLLYAIGLKREQLSQQIAYALWPDGTFVIAVFSLLAILAWPLLRLKYFTALEPVSRVTALATIVSFVLIPGVLCICAVWIWSRVTLINWADVGAEAYAESIATELVRELQTDTQLLERYRDGLYASYSGKPCEHANSGTEQTLSTLPVGVQDLGDGAVPPVPVTPTEDRSCETRYLEGEPTRANPLGAWSPLRTVIALGKGGASYGPRLTVFGNVPQRLMFNVHDREYFQALLADESWQPEARRPKQGEENPWTKVPDWGFLAQRLFNRGDGARVLQIAVPRYEGDREFVGAIAGDSRVYALTASVSPLLLRFAVVDRSSGAVLFHTDDSRSLVENFLVETEQSPRLRAQLTRRSATLKSDQPWIEEHFNGRYLSEPHRFYSRPMAGVPWSVVVFYSTKELGDVAFQAGIAALVTFISIAACAILILLLVAYVRGETLLHLAAWLWPRWAWRSRYAPLAWFGSALMLALLSAAFLLSGYGYFSLAAAVGAMLAVAFGLRAYRPHQTSRSQSVVSSTVTDIPAKSAEAHYIFCVYIGVLLLSALPALYLALRFHDLSVQAFVRQGLISAGQQIERRHATIAEDLRRWDPDDQSRSMRYPDAWALTDNLLPVPGMSMSRRPPSDGRPEVSLWTLTAFAELPWANRNGPPSEESLLPLIWSVTAESPVPQRSAWRGRDGDTPQGGDTGNGGSASSQASRPTVRNADPGQPSIQSETYWQREYDGHRTKLAVPYTQQSASHSIPATVRYGLMILLAAGTLLAVNFLALRITRKLFGSGNVFAYGELASKAPALDFALHEADANFQGLWDTLAQEDQLILYQLSKDQLINPASTDSIGRLVQAGLIKFDPWPKIVDPAFKQFAKTAEDEADFSTWQSEAAKSLWNSIRTPLLILLLIVVGLLLWLSNTSMQIVMTVLAGLATLLGYLGQAQNFIRGSGGSKS